MVSSGAAAHDPVVIGVKAPFVSRYSRVMGCAMHARVGPVRPGRAVVVLVHGVVVSGSYLEPVGRVLASRYTVLIPDLPGYGLSSHPTGTPDTPGLADALREWMSANRLPPPILLGNSYGCQILADLAARHPEWVRGLILTGPTLDPAGRTFLRPLLRQAAALRHEHPGIVARVTWDILCMGFARALRSYHHLLHDHVEQNLPRVAPPTLVVRGEHDRVVPQRWAERVTRLLPRACLHVLPRGAHVMNYTLPEALAAVVEPFIDEVWPATTSPLPLPAAR
jgi:2-hydroxy-6-oxonona-2,4-dienedioate hydrolase